ncbi:MAG: hypothetical protein HY843_07330, partial [Bdellovibrio sp.]|nr:hypothetical protein [Bdellovibrio sp.]
FKGNQKDAAGSWNFIFSDKGNILSPVKNKFIKEFNTISRAKTEEEKNIALIKLHEKVLQGAYLVPFMVGKSKVFASKRIDLSLWNPFDMRLRFYDIRWK